MLSNEVSELLRDIKETVLNKSPENTLPENCYFTKKGDILCCERAWGESRYPYMVDGLTLWAHSGGHFHAVEGVLSVFSPPYLEREPAVGFFALVPTGNGDYFPVSITGGCRQLFEPFKVERFVVYKNAAAYYIADTEFATFAIRAALSSEKVIYFSFSVINKTQKNMDFALATYIEPLLKSGYCDDMWAKNLKQATCFGNGKFLCRRINADYHYMGIVRQVKDITVTGEYHTAVKADFMGGSDRTLSNAESLRTGKIETQSDRIGKVILPAAAEIVHLSLEGNGAGRIDYGVKIGSDQSRENEALLINMDPVFIDNDLKEAEAKEKASFANLKMEFSDWKGKLNNKIVNRFLVSIQKQVSLCAFGKNYVDHLIGIRDVFQQLEQGLIWDPATAREKIIRSIGFIFSNGRAPRQFSYSSGTVSPRMDTDSYIDQGNWIISTVYTYLAYTGDYSILDEEATYYNLLSDGRKVHISDEKTTVLEHIIRITRYIESNIDTEDGTMCVRALKGDWNDAIDGLGATKDPGKTFGTGVSVMVSLHFYQNLKEMSEILSKIGGYSDLVDHYAQVSASLKDGLLKYAVDTDDAGNKRLIHGWGDHRSYLVGSFKDIDGVPRISFAPNAFWATSGLMYETPELKSTAIKDLKSLDSKYGLLTNYPPFTKECLGIGRMINTMPGTAENACTYVHASMFSVAALFAMGEAKFAWEQLEKLLIISREKTNKTPFVMSNSYCYNPEEGIDGLSAIDWFTGTGTVLVKNFVRYGFGIEPKLDGLKIRTASYMPSDSASITFKLKGKTVTLKYRNAGNGSRSIELDGTPLELTFDPIMNNYTAFIADSIIQDGAEITVTD